MTASAGFAELLHEYLAPLGGLALKRMFGSTGLFCHGIMFGLVRHDTLFLRVDAGNRAAYDAQDALSFTYRRAGEVRALAYRAAPDSLLDEPEEMLRWAREALAAAHRVARARG